MKLIPNQFRNKMDWCQIKAADSKTTNIQIIGPIDSWWGVDPNAIVKQILSLDTENLDIWINSIGGDVFGSISVYNALKAYNGRVRTFNLGLAASAAAIISMAGQERYMLPESMLMIHKAWTMTVGNSVDHAGSVNVLSKIDDLQARIFSKNSNVPIAQVDAMLKAETWMNKEDAGSFGFAQVWEGNIPKDIPQAEMDVSIFDNVPERVKAKALEDSAKIVDAKKEMELKLVREQMKSRIISSQNY